MKLSKISLALATLCAAAPAFAITASNYGNTSEFSGDTLNIRISGASAQDNGILGSALSLCVAGTVHRYSISNNAVYYCTPDVGTNAGQISIPNRTPAVTKLAIYKYSVGGSAFGVTAINSNVAADGSALGADANQLPFLDLTKINALCTGTFATTTAAATFGTALSTYVNVACSNASGSLTTLATTYIGVSDVEPAFFSNKTSNIASSTSYALIFGVPVSKNIRDALQTQQLGAACTGLETEACMPSLSSAQVVSAYTQLGQSWSGIGVTSGLADDTIYVARRVNSSGTQKTFEALIAHAPNGEAANKSCAGIVDAFVAPDSSAVGLNVGDSDTLCSSATPPLVFGGSGGGNVRNCMINHNAQGRGAIGILTTEDKAGTANWRFVKVDGVTPNQAQTAAGKYRFYVESTINTRSGGAFATAAASGYPAFVSRLKSDFSNPAIIKLINGADQTFGPAGLMALLPAGGTPDYTGASSVMPWTKLVSGTSLDNCQAPKATF